METLKEQLQMALVNYKYSVSMLCFALVTFLLVGHGAGAQINPFCYTTEDPKFCSLIVKNAKTAKQAAANAINASLEVAKRMKPVVKGVVWVLPRGMLQVTKDSIISTCNENYEMMMDNLTGALEDLRKSGDKFSVMTKLSAPCLSDCVDGLEQFNVYDSDVERASGKLTKYVGFCLAVSTQI